MKLTIDRIFFIITISFLIIIIMAVLFFVLTFTGYYILTGNYERFPYYESCEDNKGGIMLNQTCEYNVTCYPMEWISNYRCKEFKASHNKGEK